MTAMLRDRYHTICCDVLDSVEPDSPTLCEGWTAHDLAVHLWCLKRDPLSWSGMVIPGLGAYADRRAEAIKRRWPYRELVVRLREAPATFACMPGDRFESYRHALGEYYVHVQDVARPNDIPQPAPDAALQDALWRRVRVAALMLHWRTSGLVLARPGGPEARITPGAQKLTVTGEPTELMCWVYGRRRVADVGLRVVSPA